MQRNRSAKWKVKSAKELRKIGRRVMKESKESAKAQHLIFGKVFLKQSLEIIFGDLLARIVHLGTHFGKGSNLNQIIA